MSVSELHPDDLLDKESRGDLSNDERARLDEHLAACTLCRFERDVRGDFRADFEELASQKPQPKRRDDRPVMSDALAGARARKRTSRIRLVGIIAAALLVASGAAAEWRELWHDASETPPAAVSPSVVVPAAPASHVAPSGTGPAAAAAANAALADAETPAVEASPTAAASDTVAPPQAPHAPAIVATVATTQPIASSPPTATASTPEPPPETPGALFSRASDARQRGAYDVAIRLYGDLAQRYPGSVEAMNAHAILGRLLLDRGDAASALAHFDAYLGAGSGGLREEAMVGRALALQRLGRARDEASAWSALLAAYPKSVHAARANARLAALENR